MPRPLIPALALALLAACAGTAPLQDQAVPPAPQEAAEQPVAERPERAIPEESLYPLLLAEFAIRRRDYGVALEQYMEQARTLQDPAISAHTTHLARFMHRDREALEAALLWVGLEPDSVEANNAVATLLIRQGRTVEALPHLAVVAHHGVETNFPILLSGFEAMEPAEQDALVRGIDELAVEFPEDISLMLTQALVMAQRQEFEPALEKIAQIYQREPYQQQAVLLETRILVAREDPTPFARLERALEENPDDQQLRLQYARLLATSDLTAARRQFEILSAKAPRDGDLLLSLALINRETGDNLEARAYLNQMLALGQREDEANYYLGRIAEDAGDGNTALSYYRKVQGGRELLGAAQRAGLILLEGSRLEEFKEWFNQLRQAQASQREPLYILEGELLSRVGETGAAMDALNRGLGKFPNSDSLRYARSVLSEQLGDLELMESDLRDILGRDPDNATALNALGYTLANHTERYDEAFDLISRALALQPDEPAILDSMGWILYRRGRNQEALEYLTRAYAAFPDPEVAAHLGEVLWVSGDTEGATRIWRGALLRDPEHRVLLGTLQRLGVPALLDGQPPAAPR